jgi:hypothetical protein
MVQSLELILYLFVKPNKYELEQLADTVKYTLIVQNHPPSLIQINENTTSPGLTYSTTYSIVNSWVQPTRCWKACDITRATGG